MKKIITYIVAILLMTPPQLVHNDTIVYTDVETHLCSANNAHEDFHHKNDTEHDKKTKHHHHCTVEILTLTAYIGEIISTPEVITIHKKTNINYHKELYTSTFIGNLFRPPIFLS